MSHDELRQGNTVGRREARAPALCSAGQLSFSSAQSDIKAKAKVHGLEAGFSGPSRSSGFTTWSRFLKSECGSRYDLQALLSRNTVNIIIPAPATSLDCIKMIAAVADAPLPIDHLDPALGEEPFIRGVVFSGVLGNALNSIAVGYQDMIWWVSDSGLVMQIVEPPPSTAGLSTFDRIAGAKVPMKSSGERLSQLQLESIATELDAAGEKLKESVWEYPGVNTMSNRGRKAICWRCIQPSN